MTLCISMPLPAKALSPNGRAHWRVKAKAAADARQMAKLLALEQLGTHRPRHKTGTIQIKWYSKTAMHPDDDNATAACKAHRDGIADSGFLANDRHLTSRPVLFFVDRQNPRIEIHITVQKEAEERRQYIEGGYELQHVPTAYDAKWLKKGAAK